MNGPKELREGHSKLMACSTQKGHSPAGPNAEDSGEQGSRHDIDFPWTEEAHGHAGSSRTSCVLMPFSSRCHGVFPCHCADVQVFSW